MVVLAPHGGVAKKFPIVRFSTHKLIVSVDAVGLGLNFLPQSLQANTLLLCCRILCWLNICTDLKVLSQTLQGWTHSLSCALSRHTDPIKQQHDFPQKLALNTRRYSCQQKSTPIHVILKADPRLNDDVAEDKADPLVCLQLNQISVLHYFLETAGSMNHQHVLRQAVFF